MGRDTRHYAGPGRVAHWLPVLLVAALFGSAVAAHRYQFGPEHLGWLSVDPAEQPELVAPPPGLDLPTAAVPGPVLAEAPVAASVRAGAVRRALRAALGDPQLGPEVSAGVGALGVGAADVTLGPAQFTPASTTKVLTAVTALSALGPDHRFRTSVVAGAGPDDVVLVGGGDPMLSAEPPLPGTYPAHADLTTLAGLVGEARAAAGATAPVRVRYDATLYAGDGTNPRWREDYIPDDVVAPIGALMLDGGREDGGLSRADDPARATAQAFARALEGAGVAVRGKVAPAAAADGAAELGVVESAPLADQVERVISVSDNEGAELLAHAAGLAVLDDGSFAGGVAATAQVLGGLGVDTSQITLYDGSGLSRDNLIGSGAMLQVLRLAADPAHPELRAAWTGLPTAGFDGSLTYRFAEQTPALGLVRAKTGTLTGVHSLAGFAYDATGTPLVFVLAADSVDAAAGLDAQAALDRAAAALTRCRCSTPAS